MNLNDTRIALTSDAATIGERVNALAHLALWFVGSWLLLLVLATAVTYAFVDRAVPSREELAIVLNARLLVALVSLSCTNGLTIGVMLWIGSERMINALGRAVVLLVSAIGSLPSALAAAWFFKSSHDPAGEQFVIMGTWGTLAGLLLAVVAAGQARQGKQA